jgi:hypothetical protein
MNKLSISTAARGPISFAIKARLAAALLLTALLVSSASAQFIYVANAGEDTVSKIDITTNVEVARYATWFTSGTNHIIHTPIPPAGDKAHQGPAPSRIAQDSAGFVYVLDRFWGSHLPVLLKIAPTGAPTSSGSGFSAVLPILDSNSNNDIDSGEAADKRILWAKSIGNPVDVGQLGRALAIDTTGMLWVGLYGTSVGYLPRYYRVDPASGTVLPPVTGVPFPTPAPAGSYGAYSAQVDVNGKLWSVDEHHTLTEIDTLNASYPAIAHSHSSFGDNYSVSIYNDCSVTPPKVKVYLPDHTKGQVYIVYDPQTGNFSNPPPLLASSCPTCLFQSVSIGVDLHGDIVSGEWSTTGRVIKSHPNGQLVWDTNTLPAGPAVTARDLHGLIIDSNDDVWAVHWYENRVVKYSGVDGHWIATVPVGDQPYTYGNAPPPTCTGSPAPTPTPTPNPTPTQGGGCADVSDKEIRCLPGGGYSYTFNVANNSGSAMSQILLTPVAGSTFTLSPQLTNLSSPLPNGQSTTVSTTIGNAKPGDKVCFFVSLLAEKDPCCNVQVCLTMPRCGEIEGPTHPPPVPRLRPGKKRP